MPVWLTYTAGFLILAVLGTATLWRARREMFSKGRLAPATVVMAAGACLLHLALTIMASWNSTWSLEIDRIGSVIVGGLLAIVGAMIHLAGGAEFGSLGLTAGLDNSRLVGSGIYRISRNPQSLGWGLVLSGWALMARSALALLLAALFWVMLLVYLPVEEWFLERRFGDEYRQYRSVTPRFIGLPRRRPPPGVAVGRSRALGEEAPGRETGPATGTRLTGSPDSTGVGP